jgi:integrase
MQVKAHYQAKRKSPWEARWWINGRMKTRFFGSERERDRFIREFTRQLTEHGTDVFSIDKARVRRWQEADELTGRADPVEMALLWLRVQGDAPKHTLDEAISEYLEHLRMAGRTQAYIGHVKNPLLRFAAEHGARSVDEISTAHIKGYLGQLPFQPITVRHERTHLSSAFKWFYRQEWISRNPVDSVAVPTVVREEPGILSVEETERLLRASQGVDPAICGLLALGAFAGLRSSAIERVRWEEIDFANRGILIPADKAKKRRRHYIEGLPDNLWAWLERTPKAAFRMTPRQVAKARERAYVRAGLLVTKAAARKKGIRAKFPPKNCLRHSFVSYHVALHRDPGKTALLVSHRNQNILWQHYLGVAHQHDAERYFSIQPVS